MNIDEFVNRPSTSWLASDDDTGMVISSRIRLARNLRGAAFPSWAGEAECERIYHELEPILVSLPGLQPGFSAEMPSLTDLDKQILFERHLMSREMAGKTTGSGLIGTLDEQLAVMVNEEDHMRIQSLHAGLALREAWETITDLDTQIETHVRYAFSPKLGYLTACPSNVGTGMRASVMLHLPGLVLMNEMNPIIKGMGKIGLAVRGLWGEGTEATGNMFQISNQVTLGEREEDIISNLEQIVQEVVEHEKNARIRLLQERELLIRDHVGRAHGILSNAFVLSSKEALDLLSGLRLGIDVNVLQGINGRMVDELLLLTQPGHLQKIEGRKLKPKDRDEARARIVRTRLAKAVGPRPRNKKNQSAHE